MKPRAPTDTRKYQRQTNTRLFLLVLVVLVLGGAAVTALGYGLQPAAVSLVCLAAGAGLLVLLWIVFTLIGKVVGEE